MHRAQTWNMLLLLATPSGLDQIEVFWATIYGLREGSVKMKAVSAQKLYKKQPPPPRGLAGLGWVAGGLGWAGVPGGLGWAGLAKVR